MKMTIISLALLFFGLSLSAQQDTPSGLFEELRHKDSLLFEAGFNNCELARFDRLLSENFEFYHDQAGPTRSKAAFIESVRNNICNAAYRPKRVLEKGSLQVFPLEKNGSLYGAIQTGIHNFFALEKDKPEYLTSSARFNHLWLLEGGQWKLSRCLSYDHKDKPKPDGVLFRDRAVTEQWLREKKIPALGIGYIRKGVIEQASVFGELEKGKPAPLNTIWNVASMTKPITALVALKLVSQGKWSLDEPVFAYYTDPDVADDPRAKKLTTRHILSHQTGFPNWRRMNKDKKLAFEFEPGTGYRYSGEGYEYLRKALEKKFNTGLDKLAAELIFNPLRMKDTRFYWDKGLDPARFAKWHMQSGEQYETYRNTQVNAADDLLTTVEDYCRFMQYVLNGAGLPDTLYSAMISEQVRVNDRKHWGLGWWVDENINAAKDFAIVHGGDDVGVHTIAFLIPKTGDGLLIFTNADHGTSAFGDILLQYLGQEGKGILEAEMR